MTSVFFFHCYLATLTTNWVQSFTGLVFYAMLRYTKWEDWSLTITNLFTRACWEVHATTWRSKLQLECIKRGSVCSWAVYKYVLTFHQRLEYEPMKSVWCLEQTSKNTAILMKWVDPIHTSRLAPNPGAIFGKHSSKDGWLFLSCPLHAKNWAHSLARSHRFVIIFFHGRNDLFKLRTTPLFLRTCWKAITAKQKCKVDRHNI